MEGDGLLRVGLGFLLFGRRRRGGRRDGLVSPVTRGQGAGRAFGRDHSHFPRAQKKSDAPGPPRNPLDRRERKGAKDLSSFEVEIFLFGEREGGGGKRGTAASVSSAAERGKNADDL